MADVKFSEFADGGQLQSGDIIVGLRSGVNTQFDSPDAPGGPFLLKANNLSDVDSIEDSFVNLGTGTGENIIIVDDDFVGGIYQLPIPCPIFIIVTVDTPGNQIRLPVANVPGQSFSLGLGPEIRSINSTESFDVADSSGSSIISMTGLDSILFRAEDTSTAAGSWLVNTDVYLINSLSGNITIDSSDGSVNVTVDDTLDIIDLSVNSSSVVTLQIAYDNGPNMVLNNGTPMLVKTIIGDQVSFYDDTSNDSVCFEVFSNGRASHPINNITSTDRDNIPSPSNGDAVFVTDVSPSRPYVYNGDWAALAYLNDLPFIPTLNQGQLIIGVDASNPVAGYLVSSDSSININLSTNGEIDLTLNSTSSDTLQDAYDNGNTIEVATGRPLLFNVSQSGVVTDGVTTPSTGTNLNSNYNIYGYTFVPASNIIVTSFQVEDSTLGVNQTRTLAIYEKSTGVQVAIGTVSKTDPLVGIYRTNTLVNPVLLTGAIDYVLTAIVPPTQIYRNVADAVAGADISITEFASGDSQPFPIPMSAPTSYTATANVTPYGAFQYQVENIVSEFLVQNEGSATFFQTKSTTQATIPAPVMGTGDWVSIASPETGMMAFTSDESLYVYPRLNIFDGSNYHKFSYVDDNQSAFFIPGITASSGATSISVIKGMYNCALAAQQYTVMVAVEFSYTATATTQVFLIDAPVSVGNNFGSASQATLMGGSVYVNGSPAIGDGALLDIVANAGFGNVQLGVLTANTTGTKVVSVSFMYVIP